MGNKTYTIDDFGKMKFHGGEEYKNHKVFNTLADLIDFYDMLSYATDSGHSIFCVKGITNVDAIILSSMKCTIDSIKILFELGHINDAFALIRKYEDAVITHIYVILLMKTEFDKLTDLNTSINALRLYDNDISKWAKAVFKHDLKAGETKIAKYEFVKELNRIFKIQVQKKSKESPSDFAEFTLRQFCNNNVHYNGLKYFLWNDSYLYNNNRVRLLDEAFIALTNIFSVHFSYLFVLNPESFTSCDYMSALECRFIPEEGSQNWVASIVQDIFDKYITPNQELSKYLRNCNFLELK